MLVLTRKVGERIVLGQSIVVRVLQTRNGRVRLGIEAPPEVSVRRPEAVPRPAQVKVAADPLNR